MNIFRYILIALCLSVCFYAFQYFSFDRTGVIESKAENIMSDKIWMTSFYTHIMFGILVLGIGGFQFIKKLRDRYLKTHRFIGKLYVLGVTISGVAALVAAQYSSGFLSSRIGFSAMAVAWLFTNFYAYKRIRQKNIREHEFWMIRNFSVTLAAVTLRIWLGILIPLAGLSFFEAYAVVAWLSWVPNLMAAELIILRMKTRSANPASSLG